jgi:hypothetical protein
MDPKFATRAGCGTEVQNQGFFGKVKLLTIFSPCSIDNTAQLFEAITNEDLELAEQKPA